MGYKIIVGLLVLSLMFVMSPGSVQAATVSPQCAALSAKQQKVMSDIAAKETPLAQLRSKNTYNTSQSQVVFKTKVAALQKESDKKNDAILKKLLTKAKNETQKTAITSYETEFSAALKTLRTAQDTARNNYLATINALNATHRAAADSHIATLKTQIAAAFAASIVPCQKTGAEKAAAQLRASIKLAQDTYSTAPNIALPSLQPSLQVASDAFEAANDKAAVDFKATVQQSQIKLKAAIGETKYIF